jgi:redox-regulated HSP33 family molecular chaperone
MVMKRWADTCLEAFCPETKIAFLFSEISDSANLIAARLGYSTLECTVLGSLFSAFSILGLSLNRDGLDSVEVKCCSNGLIGGYFVRVNSKGEICGYIHNKIVLPKNVSQNIQDSSDLDMIFGNIGKVEVARYTEKGTRADVITAKDVSPMPDSIIKDCIEKYMKHEVEAIVKMRNPGMHDLSNTVVVINLGIPGRNRTFKNIVRKEGIEKIQELLSVCPSVIAFRVEFDLPLLMSGPNLTIQPGCICSEEKVKKEYEKVSDEEFKQIASLVNKNSTEELYCYKFRCHCCGELYTIERRYSIGHP